jgi:hypothetical protein
VQETDLSRNATKRTASSSAIDGRAMLPNSGHSRRSATGREDSLDAGGGPTGSRRPIPVDDDDMLIAEKAAPASVKIQVHDIKKLRNERRTHVPTCTSGDLWRDLRLRRGAATGEY